MYAFEEVLHLPLEAWRLADDRGRFMAEDAVAMLRAGLATIADDEVLVPDFEPIASEFTMGNYELIAKMIVKVMERSTPELSEEEKEEAEARRSAGEGRMEWADLWAHCRYDLKVPEPEVWELTLKLQRALGKRVASERRHAEKQLAYVAAFFATGHFGNGKKTWDPEDFMVTPDPGDPAGAAPSKEVPEEAQFKRLQQLNALMGGREVVANG